MHKIWDSNICMPASYQSTGRYPIAIITKTDRPDSNKGMVKEALHAMGVTHVYEVQNLREGNKELSMTQQMELLSFLERCMTDGDRIFEFRQGQ